MRFSLWLPSAALLALANAGCENTVQVEGGGGAGGGSPCPEGTFETDACALNDCIVVDDTLCQCTEHASCEPYEVEVATCDGSVAFNCRSVTACGETLFCEEPETCTAVPVCDEGDEQVPACANDGTPCYQVELCGAVISCIDNGLAHGCPPTPPSPQQSCDQLGLVCDYPLDDGCVESWTCIDPAVPGNGAPDGGFDGDAEQPVAPYVWETSGIVCVDGA